MICVLGAFLSACWAWCSRSEVFGQQTIENSGTLLRFAKGFAATLCVQYIDPPAGSPTETLLQLLLPLNSNWCVLNVTRFGTEPERTGSRV
ncbi:hypothetical protein M758_2G107300 [Ceratodon purpureus]|nr:hypothetical protein M758_2G107300 [Ceratodon purpureus]